MGLRLWLPLKGDLINRGLEPGIKVTNNQNLVTFTNNGKLGGQCAQFNSTNKNCYLQTNYYTNFGTNNFSIAFWIKIDADNVPDNYTHIVSSKGWGASDSGVCIAYFKGDDSTEATLMFRTSGQRAGCPITNFSNKWIHFIAIRDDTVSKNVRFFVNGIAIEPSGSMTIVNTGNTAFRIGIDTDKHYFPASMQMQDVRIYDHALSDKEAKELAKGLVLHYKLDYINLINKNTLTNDCYINANGTLTSTSGWFATDFIPVSFNHTYQTYKLSTGGSGTYIAFYNNAKVKTRTIAITANQDNTLIPESTETFIRLSIRNLANELKTALFYEIPTEVKDVSGYNHDGTIVGDLTLTPDTSRYQLCIQKPSGAYIRVNNRPNTIGAKDAITVNIWVNFSTWGNPISCTESGGWNFENSSGLRFIIYIASVGYKAAQSSVTPTSLANNWHMLTGTMDSSNVKFYIDGEEKGSIATGSTNGIGYANNYIFIGGEAAGNSTSPTNSNFVGKISDVRIYATALSNDDIKELYETSASIDNQSNIYSRQFEETNLNKISITDRGQLQMDAIEEDSSTASFYKDTKEIKGQLIYEY